MMDYHLYGAGGVKEENCSDDDDNMVIIVPLCRATSLTFHEFLKH